MRKETTQLLFNTTAIFLFIAFIAYGHYAVNKIANTFIETRQSEEKFFHTIVKENWKGIKSIPDEKKRVLLDNLNPELAGTDIRVMANISLILVYSLGVSLIFVSISAILKIVKQKRHNKVFSRTRDRAG